MEHVVRRVDWSREQVLVQEGYGFLLELGSKLAWKKPFIPSDASNIRRRSSVMVGSCWPFLVYFTCFSGSYHSNA